MTLALLYLALGLVLLYYGAEALVRGSSSLALRLGLSPLVIGLTVVAFGTSSPELVVSLKAGLAGQGNISVGNVVGSNICNLGLILGICALVTPIATTSQIVRIDIPIMITATAFTTFLLWDGTLGRTEGIILSALLLAYIVFSVHLARRQPADALGAEFDTEVKASKRGLFIDLLMVAGGLVLLIFGARFLVDGAVVIARAFGWSEALIGLTVIAVGLLSLSSISLRTSNQNEAMATARANARLARNSGRSDRLGERRLSAPSARGRVERAAGQVGEQQRDLRLGEG
jgi:cation:H+ antiporter